MLVSLADMKTYLGVSGAADDAFLTQQINLVSETIETYCRRKFLSDEYIQTYYRKELDSDRLEEVLLFHFPLTALASIKVDEETASVDPTLYRIHKPSATVRFLDGWDMGWEKLTVQYTAGYTAAPLPVQEVVYQLVGERYNKKKSGVALNFGSDVQRVSIPGTISIDFDYSLQSNERKTFLGSILGNTVNILDSYRSERAVIGELQSSYVEEAP